MTDCRPGRTLARLEALLEDASVSGDYVRLRMGLLEAQAEVLAALGEPAGSVETVDFPAELVLRLFDRMAACGAATESARVSKVLRDEAALAGRLAREAAFQHDGPYLASLAKRLDVPHRLLVFWGRLLAAPFVIHAAGSLTRPDASTSESAESAGCPVCDSPPALGGLRREDGKRILYCSLCGRGWPADRLACPFCPGDESGPIRLEVDGDDTRWIEACPACKQYLRITDARHLPEGQEIVPLVEDALGLHLNLLAEREGFDCPMPYTGM